MLCTTTLVHGQIRRIGIPRGVAGPGSVNLPYITGDAQGNQWMVYGPGNVQMQGNSPTFGQAGQLTVNNMQPMSSNNIARLDEKTGEVILENMTAGTLVVTRRVQIKADTQTVRFVDIFSNPTAAVQTLNARWTTNVNFGVQSSSIVSDPKRKGQNLAWVAQTNNNQGAFEWVAGPGAKVAPTLQSTPNQPFVQSTLTIAIPANGKIAVVHYDGATDSTATANKWIADAKPKSLLADLPNDVRQIIVNMPARAAGLSPDIELLRGDLLDVVELQGGDRLVGTVSATSFKVSSVLGAVDLPTDHLLGMVSTGAKPLWVLGDGQILSGPVDAPALQFESAGGGSMTVAWSQIARLGFRHRQTEPADAPDGVPPLPAPVIGLLSGDRFHFTPSVDAIDIVTRYGLLHLPTAAIGSLSFVDPETPVDVITLTDGSRFTGLTTVKSVGGNALLGDATKPNAIDVDRISLLELHDAPDDAVADGPTLVTTTGNSFSGPLQQAVALRTSAGVIHLDAGVISAAVVDEDSHGLKITTADGTSITGKPIDDAWDVRTVAGIDVKIPTRELKSYTNPGAAPSTMSRSGLDPWISQLNAEDWKQRDAAEHALLKLGPAVSSALHQARDKQPPEAQQRIDSILKQLDAADHSHGR